MGWKKKDVTVPVSVEKPVNPLVFQGLKVTATNRDEPPQQVAFIIRYPKLKQSHVKSNNISADRELL